MTRVRTTRTPDGKRLEVSHVLGVSAADAWDALVDTTQWPAWSPTIRGVESSDRRIQAGTTGRVRLPGVWVPFEITACTERRWSWCVLGIPTTGHRVDDLGNGRCRIAFELPLSQTGYAPVCLRSLNNIASLLEDETAHNAT